jgi:hypothetical protein
MICESVKGIPKQLNFFSDIVKLEKKQRLAF